MREHDRQVLAADRAERLRRYDEAMLESNTRSKSHLTASEIANCTLCDNEGYRPAGVCDHLDRTHIAAAGIARVRAALAKGKP